MILVELCLERDARSRVHRKHRGKLVAMHTLELGKRMKQKFTCGCQGFRLTNGKVLTIVHQRIEQEPTTNQKTYRGKQESKRNRDIVHFH